MKFGDNPAEDMESNRVRQQASNWIAKRDNGFSAAEQDAFFDWLAADPKHAEVYAELQSVFKQMDIMVEWRPMFALEPNPDLLAGLRPHLVKPWWLTLVAGMAAVLALVLFLGGGRQMTPAPGSTLLAEGEVARSYERHVLEDGSIVELNRGGQVSLRFEPKRRLLDLIAGEAHFKVAKDPNRPFVVRVGGVEVTAVGTEFHIALSAGEVEVFVTEGRIRIDPPVHSTDGKTDLVSPALRTLDAGQGMVVNIDAPISTLVVVDYSPQIVEQRLAWKNELVDFADVPLSEVILAFNRRNHTQVVISDEELGARPISGTLRPTNLEGFLELLTVTQHIQIERFGTSKVVLRAQP